MAIEQVRGFTGAHPSIDDGVDVLSDRVLVALAAVVGVVVLNILVVIAYIATIGDPSGEVPIGVAFLSSGIGLLVPMAIIWSLLDTQERAGAFPFRAPSLAELGWTLAFVPLGIAAFAAGTEVASVLGFTFEPFDYDLTNPVTAAGVLVGPILLAPLVEEALFRGLLLGSLVGRGWSPLVAGLATILLFAGLHVWLGVAGMIGIAAWVVFPTILRLRFDNLTGAVLLHLLNNVYAYVIAVQYLH